MFPNKLSYQSEKIRIAFLTIVLLIGLTSYLLHQKQKITPIIVHAAIWSLLSMLILTAYTFRHELVWFRDRLLGELITSSGQNYGTSMHYNATNNGHFLIEAGLQYDDKVTHSIMLLDTGATKVLITRQDASNLGFNVETIMFSESIHTANGVTFGAPIILDKISLGAINVKNVRASIIKSELKHSLLGMSFLERLSRFEVKSGTLILYP